MAQADPSASSTNLQPRRSTRQPKPARRDPHFIYTDFQRHLANLDDERDLAAASLVADSQDVSALKGTKRKTKRSISKQSPQILDPDFPYADIQSQLYGLHLPDQDQEASPSSDPKLADISPSTSNGPKSHSSSPASPERDLNQEIRLVQLQKVKLALELEVLRLRHALSASPDGQADENPNSSASVEKTRRSALLTGHTSLLQVITILLIMISLSCHSS